jgi:hypothetical protein
MPDVRCERKGQALWLTIDREERRNALNEAVFDGLRAGIAQAEASPEVRAVVITGAGEKAFCAGGDLKPNAEGDPFTVDAAERDNPAVKLFRAIIDCRVPVIARVNGHALAGGFGLVCACDFAVVADHARLGVPAAASAFSMMILPFMLRSRGGAVNSASPAADLGGASLRAWHRQLRGAAHGARPEGRCACWVDRRFFADRDQHGPAGAGDDRRPFAGSGA